MGHGHGVSIHSIPLHTWLSFCKWKEGTRRVPTVIHLGYETSKKYDESGSPYVKEDVSNSVGSQRSSKSWPFIRRNSGTQMKNPPSAQYVMCGRNLSKCTGLMS